MPVCMYVFMYVYMHTVACRQRLLVSLSIQLSVSAYLLSQLTYLLRCRAYMCTRNKQNTYMILPV